MVLAVVPRGGLAVAGARPQAAMQGADEAVAEDPQRLVLEITRGAACAAMSAGRAAMPARPSGTRPVASRSPPAVIRWSSCWVSAQSSPTYRFSGFRLLPVVRLALTVVPATTQWLSAHGHDTPSGLPPTQPHQPGLGLVDAIHRLLGCQELTAWHGCCRVTSRGPLGAPLPRSSKDGRLDSRVRGHDGLNVAHFRSLRVVRTASTSR